MNKKYICRDCKRVFILQILNSIQQEIVVTQKTDPYCSCVLSTYTVEHAYTPSEYEARLDKIEQLVKIDTALGRILWTNSKNSIY